MEDALAIGGRELGSRLFLGTGKFPSVAALRDTIASTGTELVTVALRRVDPTADEDILDAIDLDRVQLLPNTSGAVDADATRPSAGRPARNPRRPASTARRKAAPMAAGSPAVPMAVFTSTASAPSSIASAACDGAPMPASTTTGTSDCSMMISSALRVRRPWLEPIHDPSGITVAQPASSRCLHSTGSAEQYGSTTKPSSQRMRAAFSVSTGSGRR